MKSIAIELSIFLVGLVLVIFCFSFFISWVVASLDLKVKQLEKDLNGLGREMRERTNRVGNNLISHQGKFNALVGELNLPRTLRDNPSDSLLKDLSDTNK